SRSNSRRALSALSPTAVSAAPQTKGASRTIEAKSLRVPGPKSGLVILTRLFLTARPSGYPASADAFDACQVAPALYLEETACRQQGAHGLGLVVAMLEQQPAARFQVGRGAVDDGAQGRQAVGMVGQRADRLEAQV